jgi:hypothetical protein
MNFAHGQASHFKENAMKKLIGLIVVGLMVLAGTAWAGAPNGATLASTITVTDITVYSNVTLNARSVLPANPKRIGLWVFDTTAAAIGSTNVVVNVESNKAWSSGLYQIPMGGVWTNDRPGTVYQGAWYFVNSVTNAGGVIPTGTVHCVEFNASP